MSCGCGGAKNKDAPKPPTSSANERADGVGTKGISWIWGDKLVSATIAHTGGEAKITAIKAAPMPKPAQGKPSKAPMPHRWMWMTWIGVPLPVRLWRRLFYLDSPEDWYGCGCIWRVKRLFGAAFG